MFVIGRQDLLGHRGAISQGMAQSADSRPALTSSIDGEGSSSGARPCRQ
jgi:hypothetical protein